MRDRLLQAEGGPAGRSQQRVKESVEHDNILRVLNFDRDCPEWTKYVLGLDPKDHLMERRLHDLEDDRKAFHIAPSKGGRWLTYAALNLAAAPNPEQAGELPAGESIVTLALLMEGCDDSIR